MNHILLLLDHKENRRLLAEWLGPKYQVIPDGEQALDEPFDLGILDGPALDRLWEQVQARKEAEQPVFLPFLLVTARKDVRYVTCHLWRTVDELILTPLEKVELQARVEILLRARQLSLQLQAEAIEQLRLSEERYRYISEVALDYLYAFQIDPDGTMRGEWVSDSFVHVFGYTIPEIDARGGWQTMVHPEDLPVAIEHAKKVVSGQSDICEMRFVTRDREARWLRDYAKPVFDEAQGRVVRIYGASQDITERKQAEEEIRRRADELAALNALGRALSATLSLEETSTAAVQEVLEAVYPDVAFLFLREGEKLTLKGVGPETARQRLGEFPEHQVGACLCGLAVREGHPLYSQDIFSDARCTWEECKRAGLRSFAALPLRSGEEIIGVVGLASRIERDFAAQSAFLETLAAQVAVSLRNVLLYDQVQRYAAELEQRVVERTAELEFARDKAQEADRLKSVFLATMSHELRTPLNSIIGFTGMLLEGWAGPLNEEQDKQLKMVYNSAKHLLTLINDILDLSKIEAGQLELHPSSFSLPDLITEVVRTVYQQAMAKGLELRVQLDPRVETITADRRRMEQILLNLVSNAIKFTEAGQVTIKTRSKIENQRSKIEIQVVDTGIGIRAEDMDKLFQEFRQLEPIRTRRYEGTGLGLAICKKLVTMMGGEIWAESEGPGKGSTFTVELPGG
ncbi:MAG: ATP-binding protein [Anaerolineae bacterium]|jgi:PAS domain S-box-containing protein|nr:ATP-binding protein [Anaerolineae bacterium]MDH7475356.1 ATP-binding protein [Anaerolineae bacterium]